MISGRSLLSNRPAADPRRSAVTSDVIRRARTLRQIVGDVKKPDTLAWLDLIRKRVQAAGGTHICIVLRCRGRYRCGTACPLHALALVLPVAFLAPCHQAVA